MPPENQRISFTFHIYSKSSPITLQEDSSVVSFLEGVGGGANLAVANLAHKAYFSKFLKNKI